MSVQLVIDALLYSDGMKHWLRSFKQSVIIYFSKQQPRVMKQIEQIQLN